MKKAILVALLITIIALYAVSALCVAQPMEAKYSVEGKVVVEASIQDTSEAVEPLVGVQP